VCASASDSRGLPAASCRPLELTGTWRRARTSFGPGVFHLTHVATSYFIKCANNLSSPNIFPSPSHLIADGTGHPATSLLR
jgi:hypothetical protein